MLANVNNGPGPTHPPTDFKDAYTFVWKKKSTFNVSATFNTTWVSYIYVFDAATHNVVAELTNDSGSTSYVAGINLHDTDLTYGVVNYHKYQISPGRENAADEFFQGGLAMNDVQQTGPEGETRRIGFTDGHGAPDNAVATIQTIFGP